MLMKDNTKQESEMNEAEKAIHRTATHALERWETLKKVQNSTSTLEDDNQRGYRMGLMSAYASVLHLLTRMRPENDANWIRQKLDEMSQK